MKQQQLVVDLVKAAFFVLIVKVMASYSAILPWNSLVDNLCIVFALSVMLAKFCPLTFPLNKLFALGAVALLAVYTTATMKQ